MGCFVPLVGCHGLVFGEAKPHPPIYMYFKP
jgi:hypothetical protein